MSLIKIGEFIDRQQAKPFVKVYLTCLAEGYQLSCPVSKDPKVLFDDWAKVLAKYRENFTDEFCQSVSTFWLELLNKCDENNPQIELQLFEMIGITEESLRKSRIQKNMPDQPKTTIDIPTSQDATKQVVDTLTKPEISESYQQRRLAEEVSLPELEKLQGVYQKSFKNKSVAQFLISHLTFAKYQVKKEVPRSTVPQNIREKWEHIIASEFDTIADDTFLAELTNEWFYLVNQRGIPTTFEHQEDMLMTYLAKQQQSKDVPKRPQPKQSFLKKLFGK